MNSEISFSEEINEIMDFSDKLIEKITRMTLIFYNILSLSIIFGTFLLMFVVFIIYIYNKQNENNRNKISIKNKVKK